MFERFTVAAREVVTRARDEAIELGAPLIGTEHLLLALLDDRATAAYPVLTTAGISHDGVRAALRRGAAGPAGLLSAEDADALRTIGIDLDAVLARIGETFGADALQPPAPRTGRFGRTSSARRFSPRARKAMGLALREAIRLGDKHIDDRHILLGLLRGECGATRILEDQGVPAEQLRAALRHPGERAA